MQEHQIHMWINELKIDFPEYSEAIELLDWQVEQFLELAEDYYFCNQQIKMLKKTGKSTLITEFMEAHNDLEREIRLLLSAKKSNA